jgi:UDP-glucose 4-epimerase
MGNEHVIPEFANRMARLGPEGGPFPIQGTGEETRSFCFIDDAIDGLMILNEKGENREVYHLGNPAEEYTIRNLAYRMADWFGLDLVTIPGQLSKGSPVRRAPDIGKMRALGFEPRWSLEDGLNRTLPWYQKAAMV